MSKINKIIKKIKRLLRRNVYVQISVCQEGALLEGKTVVVTGGNEGIGYSISEKCLLQGARVILIGRNRNKLDDAIQKLKEIGKGDIEAIQWDLNNLDLLEDKFSEILQKADGHIDCWVNNAGIYRKVNFRNCTEDDWNALWNVNLKAPFFITNKVAEFFISNKIKGNIINIASETGVISSTQPYALAKGALIQYSKGLACELGQYGIRVNVVAPGMVATEGIAGINYNEALDTDKENTLSGRFLIPQEIAETVVFLLSNQSLAITGQVIEVNMGNTIKSYTRGIDE